MYCYISQVVSTLIIVVNLVGRIFTFVVTLHRDKSIVPPITPTAVIGSDTNNLLNNKQKLCDIPNPALTVKIFRYHRPCNSLKNWNFMDSMLSLLSLSNNIYGNGRNLCFIMVVSLYIYRYCTYWCAAGVYFGTHYVYRLY